MDRLITLQRVLVDFLPENPYCESKGDVVNGNDVWIRANVTILGGVSIGNGTSVAEGPIVTNAVAPCSIVAGSPARGIRMRFNKATISYVEQMKCRDWSDQHLLENKSLFSKPFNAI